MSQAVLVAALLAGLVQVDEGRATAYAPGVMDVVVRNRLRWGQLDYADVARARGTIALQDCRHLGQMAWLQWPGGAVTGPYLVADCGAERDQAHLDRIGFAVDLSYELALEFLPSTTTPLAGVRVFVAPFTGATEQGREQ